MYSRLIFAAFIALSSLPVMATEQTTVTTNITFSTTTKGPITCDMVINGRYIFAKWFSYEPSGNRGVLSISATALGTAVASTLEVLGETVVSPTNVSNRIVLRVGGGTPDFLTLPLNGQNIAHYNFGLSSGTYSGSIRVAGSFPDGFSFSFSQTGLHVNRTTCIGQGVVELFFTGTLSQ